MLAEGVETETQSRMLAQDGCDELQGFLFARPMEASEVERFCAAASVQAHAAAHGFEPRGAGFAPKSGSVTSPFSSSARALP